MRNLPIAACLPLILVLSIPASAQSMAELDRLSDITANEDTGIAAAQEQASRGAYLEALATLERVMAVFPTSAGARLLHAVYLCRIDDRQGGLVEISQMDEDDFGRANLADARDRCNQPYVEPQPARPSQAPPPAIQTITPPPSSAAVAPGGKDDPAPPVAEPAAPVPQNPPPAGSNAISGGNSVSTSPATGTTTGSSSSSASQQPENTQGGEKD